MKVTKKLIRSLASGDELFLRVFTFSPPLSAAAPNASNPIPKVFIQASVHGAEVQGNMALAYLMLYLESNPPLGTITCLPMANPYATNNKTGEHTQGRFDPVSGLNWNRTYWPASCSSEETRRDRFQVNVQKFIKEHTTLTLQDLKQQFQLKLVTAIHDKLQGSQTQAAHLLEAPFTHSLYLQEMAMAHDIVLDLHTGPQSTYYVYTPQYAVESAREFQIANILSIPESFDGAMDEAAFFPWWQLHQELLKQNRPSSMDFESFTLELGSQEVVSAARGKEDAQRIIRYLKKKGLLSTASPDLIPLPPIESSQMRVVPLKNYIGLFAPFGALVDYQVRPGVLVKKGEALCRLLNFQRPWTLQPLSSSYRLQDCFFELFAETDLVVINHAPSAIVHQGQELLRYICMET